MDTCENNDRFINVDKVLREFPFRLHHYDKENGNEHFIYGIETVLEYLDDTAECGIEKYNNLIKEASHLLFVIGEILVDESKGNYTSEVAIDKIRKLLNNNQETEKKLTKAVMEMSDNGQT